MEHTEEAVNNFQATDTSGLQQRITSVEERVQFNSDNIDDVWETTEKIESEIKDVEKSLSDWMDGEIGKIYNILNDTGNPLGK